MPGSTKTMDRKKENDLCFLNEYKLGLKNIWVIRL